MILKILIAPENVHQDPSCTKVLLAIACQKRGNSFSKAVTGNKLEITVNNHSLILQVKLDDHSHRMFEIGKDLQRTSCQPPSTSTAT